MSSSRSREISVSVGCLKMGSNMSSRAENIDWTSSGFTAGREDVASAENRRRSNRDSLYHRTMWRNLIAITKIKNVGKR